MERDDLDGFLSGDEIVPSSGFVARVMDAVRVEASAPPAIPFPWLRALPGIVAAAVTIVAIIVSFVSLERTAIETAATPLPTAFGLPAATVAWLFVALLLCTVPVMVSLRLTRSS
jgi:hypothetical protein